MAAYLISRLRIVALWISTLLPEFWITVKSPVLFEKAPSVTALPPE